MSNFEQCVKTENCSGNEQCVTLNPNKKPPKFYKKAVEKYRKKGIGALTAEENNIIRGCGYVLEDKGCCHDPKGSDKWIPFTPGKKAPELRAVTFRGEPVKQKTPVEVVVSPRKTSRKYSTDKHQLVKGMPRSRSMNSNKSSWLQSLSDKSSLPSKLSSLPRSARSARSARSKSRSNSLATTASRVSRTSSRSRSASPKKSRDTRETLAEVIEFINRISKKRVVTDGDKQIAYFKVLGLPEGDKQEALEVYKQKFKSSEGNVAMGLRELPGKPERPSSRKKPKLTRKKKSSTRSSARSRTRSSARSSASTVLYNDAEGRRFHNPKNNFIQTNSAYRGFDGESRPSIQSNYRFKYNKPESAKTEYASPVTASPVTASPRPTTPRTASSRRTSASPRRTSASPRPTTPRPSSSKSRNVSTKKKKKPEPTKEELYGAEGRREEYKKARRAMRRERPLTTQVKGALKRAYKLATKKKPKFVTSEALRNQQKQSPVTNNPALNPYNTTPLEEFFAKEESAPTPAIPEYNTQATQVAQYAELSPAQNPKSSEEEKQTKDYDHLQRLVKLQRRVFNCEEGTRPERNCRSRYSGENGIQDLPCRDEKTNDDGKHVLCFSEDGAESKPLIDSLDDLTPKQKYTYQFYGPGNEIYKPDWIKESSPFILGEESDPSKPFKRKPKIRREPTPPKRKKQTLVRKATLPKAKGPNSTLRRKPKVRNGTPPTPPPRDPGTRNTGPPSSNEKNDGPPVEPEAPFMKEDMRIRRNPGKYNRERDCNISNLKQLETALTSRYQNMPSSGESVISHHIVPYTGEVINKFGKKTRRMDIVNYPRIDVNVLNLFSKVFNTRFGELGEQERQVTEFIQPFEFDTNKNELKHNYYHARTAVNALRGYLNNFYTNPEKSNTDKNMFTISHSYYMMELAKFSCNIPEKGELPIHFDNLDILHLEYVLGDSRLLVKNIYRWHKNYQPDEYFRQNLIDKGLCGLEPEVGAETRQLFFMRHCAACHNHPDTTLLQKINKKGNGEWSMCLANVLPEVNKTGESLLALLQSNGGLDNFLFGSSIVFRAILTGLIVQQQLRKLQKRPEVIARVNQAIAESMKPKPEPEPTENVNTQPVNNTNPPNVNNDITFSFKPGSKCGEIDGKKYKCLKRIKHKCVTQKKGDRIGTCMKKTVVKPGYRLKEFETF
jgi:hypothetical protein